MCLVVLMKTRTTLKITIIVTLILGLSGLYYFSGDNNPLAGKFIKLTALQSEDGSGVVFFCDGTLYVNKANEISGTLDWRIHEIQDTKSFRGKLYGQKLTETATEHVKGFYDQSTNSLRFHGYNISGAADLIGKTAYDLQIKPATQQITGTCTDPRGNWKGKIYQITYRIEN